MAAMNDTKHTATVAVARGEELARYGFGHGHPFGTDRHDAFWAGMDARGLDRRVRVIEPVKASREQIETFHTRQYIDQVTSQSATGSGFLDAGDTPAFVGVYDAASFVVGSTLDAVARVIDGEVRRAFVPIAGLHHARRHTAGGFCVFNDCGIAIEALRSVHGLRRIAYVDIDAHHGDGVLYGFEDDAEVFIGDIHEDGRFLYPGTGWPDESGTGAAAGTKLNLPLPPGATDEHFLGAWRLVEDHIDASQPEFVILQCGADGIEGDPLTHLRYTKQVHNHVAARLCALADRHCAGRLVALGGGGYSHRDLSEAWCDVVERLIEEPRARPEGRWHSQDHVLE
jgi:acetoin utilization protein AcuC